MSTNVRFPRSVRLRNATEYKNVMHKSQVKTTTMFKIFSKDTQHPTARLGLSVSAKRIKKAWVRNRIKRQIRETFRTFRAHLPAKDFVILYRGPDNPQSKDLRHQLIGIWQAMCSPNG